MIAQKIDEGRLIVTLDRPDKANALTAGMLETLIDVVRDSGADPTEPLTICVFVSTSDRLNCA